jgi:hypothetical protein
MKMTAALAQLSSGKGEEMAEAGVRNWGAWGSPFIGARGGEEGERWRAPASSPRRGWWRTVVTTGWLGQTRRRDGSGRRKAPNRAGERDNGEATGRAVAGGDRIASPVTGTRKALTSGTRLPERERERSRESEGECDWRVGPGWQRRRGARARGQWAPWAVREKGRHGHVGEREGVWAGNGPAEGGVFSFFFF